MTLLFMLLMAGGCASNALVGTWKFNHDDLGPLQLSFRNDYTYEVDYDADGQKDIWGRYQLFRDRIRFEDELPRVTTDCYEPGYYFYKFSGSALLHFKVMADQCVPRKKVLKECLRRLENT